MKKLSEMLKKIRLLKNFSLREVESKTGISNAYLSQLENDKIKSPSPKFLKKLSDIYGVHHRNLMELAGYIESNNDKKVEDEINNNIAFTIFNELTTSEKDEVLNFINYTKNKR
jgi:transcriptional regulator with XRE-family HTH domain